MQSGVGRVLLQTALAGDGTSAKPLQVVLSENVMTQMGESAKELRTGTSIEVRVANSIVRHAQAERAGFGKALCTQDRIRGELLSCSCSLFSLF